MLEIEKCHYSSIYNDEIETETEFIIVSDLNMPLLASRPVARVEPAAIVKVKLISRSKVDIKAVTPIKALLQLAYYCHKTCNNSAAKLVQILQKCCRLVAVSIEYFLLQLAVFISPPRPQTSDPAAAMSSRPTDLAVKVRARPQHEQNCVTSFTGRCFHHLKIIEIDRWSTANPVAKTSSSTTSPCRATHSLVTVVC